MSTEKKDEKKVQQPKQKNSEIAQKMDEKGITDAVLTKIKQFEELGELSIPKDYNVQNALKSAFLILSETEDKDKKPVLEVCTKSSIANSLLKMITMGLSPMKRQCAFIVYGSQLTCQIEYDGTIALAKRFGDVKEVNTNVIYDGDEFKFKINPDGRREFVSHNQPFENINLNKILGAYAIVVFNDGSTQLTMMNILQIRKAWDMGQMKGNSKAHQNFPDKMAEKTVATRACQPYIRRTDDEGIYNETPAMDPASEASRKEISEKANVKMLELEDDGVQNAEVINQPEKKEGYLQDAGQDETVTRQF
ncbi:MAG: recombinase RecT [Melioribacteraceae bacterium]|jgi:recombination protein RecT|nr:recombinase RecT [Melioribacteraceae bacterium]